MPQTDGSSEDHVETCPVPTSWEWGLAQTPDGVYWRVLTFYTPTGHSDFYFTEEATRFLGQQAVACADKPTPGQIHVPKPNLVGLPDISKANPHG